MEAFGSGIVFANLGILNPDEHLKNSRTVEVVRRLRELADLRNRYRDARPLAQDLNARPDIALVDAIDDFARSVSAYPQDQRTNDIVD